jgi:muramidase (phage lysozyme)
MASTRQLTPEARALLDVIAGTESAGAYNVLYGGNQFNDYTAHPNQYVQITSGPNAGQYTTAAGRYQFLTPTWQRLATDYKLPDFSPASQDLGAWYDAQDVYQNRTGRDLQSDLAAGGATNMRRISNALRGEWTSLPGGIEQGQSQSQFERTYNTALSNAVGHPVPPLGTPIGTALADAGPATGYIPFAPPAPLTPQSMQSGSPLDKLPQTAMYGLQQRLTPGQVTAPPTDFTTQDTGAPATDLMRFATPPVLPQAAQIAGGALPSIGQLGLPFASSVGAAIPPVPAPAPSFMRPQLPPAQVQQASYSPAPSTPNLVKLPSGKMVAPGVYPSQSNPGSMVTVSDDGSGNAVIKETNLGLMNPAKMGKDTVAGGYIGQQLAPAVSNAVNNAKAAIAPQVTGLASNITNGAQALGGQIGGMFSNMFGGGTPAAPSVPAPPPVYTPPTTRYTMQQMQVSNPAYLKYIAGQNADPILGGPGSFASLQAMNQPPAPPKFITVTRQIPLPALPVMAAAVLAPPSPPPMPAQPPGASFLAARGVDTSNMSAGQQANALWQSLGGSSQRGSFGI